MSTRRQPFNPLDHLLHSTDEARRPLGIPGGDIFVYCELEGQLDLEGLQRAVRQLLQKYPTLNSRLVRGTWLRKPHWNLNQPALRTQPVAVRTLEPNETPDDVLQAWLAEVIDWTTLPPLQMTLLRGRNDTLVFRWPHFLMDGLSGSNIVDQINTLYDLDPSRVDSAEDELRRDFGTLQYERPDWFWKKSPEDAPPPKLPTLRLSDAGPLASGATAPRLIIRRMGTEQAAGVRQAALGVSGFGRFADYLRATGIATLDTLLRERDAWREDGAYTTFHLLDSRKRRDPGPLCHNVFSTLPLFVPSRVGHDRAAVAEMIHERTRAALTSDLLQRRLEKLAWLARLPIPLLAGQIRRKWQAGATPHGVGPANPPALPLGFMGPLPRRTETFCGAPLPNLFGIIAPAPTAGFTVNVNAAQERMNVVIVHDPQRLSAADANRFADVYVDLLQRGA